MADLTSGRKHKRPEIKVGDMVWRLLRKKACWSKITVVREREMGARFGKRPEMHVDFFRSHACRRKALEKS